MKLSVSAYRAQASAHKKILTSSYQQHYGSTSAPPLCSQRPQFTQHAEEGTRCSDNEDISDQNPDSRILSTATSREDDDDSSNNYSNESKSPGQRTKSNQRWMKLRTTVQLSSAIQKKPPLKREDSFLKRFSTRQIPETQETVEDTGSEGATGDHKHTSRHRRRKVRVPRSVVNPDENFYFYWLWLITLCVLYNLWTLIVRQSFPELQIMWHYFWLTCDGLSDVVFALDLVVQLRTGYLEQGLMVYDTRKLAVHYLSSRPFLLDIASLTPLDLLQLKIGTNPIIRFPRFFKVYRAIDCYYIVESRTVYPNFWRVINLIHILLILAHWFGCFYFLLSEAEGFQGDWVYPHRPGDYATLTRKYLGSLYWSTLTLTTIGDLPTPETNADLGAPKFLPRRGLKSRLLQFKTNRGYVFTIVSYLIGVFIFATIVGQVGNVITNRNANRLEFERLLDGAKTYMRHHKVPGGMKRRVLRWYDYSWSRGRIQGGGDINTALGLLPDKLKTELALHVNLSVLKKVTIFQECQPEFLHDLVLKMKAYIFTPGDSICRKGEVAREMFIIADGILEVISETGRVLTTMKAGDFFGEIGILNLDGLNKRTADVRSVGYSELFSLSREDVLAAMKDYPEAQDILQTLGRKRLQEAKNMSRQRTKKGDLSPDKLGDDSTSKRIVHKIRSDVKGLRNAIRSRSRIRRGTDGDKMLRRMNRVNSDDEHHHHEDGETTSGSKDGEKEKCISPIGAGLPLLSRLKLLKEKQDREEKAAKQRHSTTSITSIHPQPSTSATVDAEPEVIGAGLPLLQRLLLLKAKEEREKNQLTPTNSNQPSSSETISPISVKSPLSPTIKNISPIRKGSGSTSPGKLQSPTTRTSRKNSSGSSDGNSKPKVSFKDKILQVQSDGTAVCQPLNKDLSEKPAALVEPTPKTESNSISIPHSVVSKIKSPAKIGTTFRDKLKMLQTGNKEPETEKKIIPPEKCTVEIIPLQINDNKEENISKKPWIKLKKASILGESKSQSKCSVDSEKSSPSETTPTGDLVKLDNNNKEKTNEVFQNPKICLTTPLEPVHEKTLDLMSLSPKQHTTRVIDLKSTSMLQPKPKNYRSIDDLSPEYGGLPFVKKLKILNERQKLAELEKVVKHRSSSLDYTSSSEELLSDTLTRSLSEGSTMDKRKYKRKSTDSVSSYESNETLERRTLKSILKKLSEESPAASPERSSEFKRLIRAPTIEGYAARHSKFSKSVTFHRHTLPSPPSSAPPNSNLSTFSLPEPAPPEISQEETENQIIKEAIIETSIDLKEYEFKQISDPIYNFRPEEIRVPEKPKLSLISAVANQRKLLRSSLEDQEYFGEVLLGIKQVIQGHLHDVQGKFQDRFNSLENEVKKRDEIISQLQKRIQELERVGGLPKSDQHDTDGHDSDAGKESSFSGDVSPSDEGFMRGDSLDTVFATSPPTVTEEPTTKEEEITDAKLAEITKDISLTELSYTELASLAESLDDKSTKDSWSASKCKRLDLNLDGKAGTYARKRAEKIKRKSWDDGSRDCYEMQRIRPLSPQSSEDRSLLSPESSLRSNRRRPFPFLDSTRSKIKKTLSVDTGMHHTGIKDGKPTVRGPRKFSLGSIFGYSKPTAQKLKQNCNDVVLDIGSDCSWSDSTSTCSSDSELPLAPGFEEFARRTTDYDASPTEVCSGGDWEVMMLAQELQRREKESKRKNTLKDLEEECDTPREESFDSNQDYSNSSSTQLLTQPIEVAQVETSFVNRQTVRNRVRSLGDYSPGTSRSETRGLVLRASSLESETTKTIEDNQKKL